MINDFTIELTKKDIKALNDMNQDLKSIFKSYYISGDIAINVPPEPVMGASCAKIISPAALTLIQTYFQGEPIKIISDNLYRVIKDHKKEITSLSVKNSDIFLDGKESYHIGRVNIFINLLTSDENIKQFKDANELFDSFTPDIELSETDVIGLVSNEYRNINYESYRTRITRQLMPGLKKKHYVHISFEDDNDELFLMKLMVYRDTIISAHQYRCLKL